ncbi:type II secretion system protein [Variovorax paradoxus]|uniref:type II secretion system protein n=1 Tax=Variovorax paradoxus TaxID=34073 RepID=UPI003D649FDA
MKACDVRSCRQRGFTYIWVLLMVALMGVGMTVAADVQTTLSQRDREKELLAIGRQYRSALASYYAARPPTLKGVSDFVAGAGQPVSGLPPAAGGAPTPISGSPPAAGSLSDPRGYPGSLDELLRDERFPGIRRHLRKIFVDPMTGKAEWGLVQVAGRIVGVHSLSTAVPIKQAGFDGDDHSFAGAQSYAGWVFGPASHMPGMQPDRRDGAPPGTPLPSLSTTSLASPARP